MVLLLGTSPLLPLKVQVGEPYSFSSLIYTYTSVFLNLLWSWQDPSPSCPSTRRLLYWPPFRFDTPVYELLFNLNWNGLAKPQWTTIFGRFVV